MNKKLIIFLFLFLLSVNIVSARMSSKESYTRIKMFADNINDRISNVPEEKYNKTISYMISNWVEQSIGYKFYYYPRGIVTTWRYLEGDCSDKAELKYYMLSYLGVKSRMVHGYDYFGVKHDTMEYWYNDMWNQHEYGFEKKGNGIW